MNVQIKYLAALLCLFCGITSFAKTFSPLPASSGFALVEDGQPCNLSAPNNYQTKDISTDEIWVGWQAPPNNPFEYNIKVFEVSTGNLINSFNIPGTETVARAVNLQPGTEYKIRNTPVCSDGTLSNNYGDTYGTTLIVDLVNTGFTLSGSPLCSLTGPTQFCEIDPPVGNVVTFKIQELASPFRYRYFGVFKSSYLCRFTTVKTDPLDGSPFKFQCINGNPAPCQGGVIKIKFNNEEVAMFSFKMPTTGFKQLVCLSIDGSKYVIERLGGLEGVVDGQPVPCPGNHSFLPAKPTERASDEWEEIPYNQTLTAVPNPFTNQLEIRHPFANINEFVEISLYDLQGRQVKALRSPGDLQTITLSTENLSAGMYFLRAESGGQIETVKVVKTQ